MHINSRVIWIGELRLDNILKQSKFLRAHTNEELRLAPNSKFIFSLQHEFWPNALFELR
jgi:hypothetical protein